MTIKEIIEAVDSIHSNKYDDTQKMSFISNLDAKISDDLLKKYNKGQASFTPYKNVNQSVIAPTRYKMMYVLYVISQIDFFNAEPERFNNDMLMFNNEYMEYERAYIRDHSNDIKEFKI